MVIVSFGKAVSFVLAANGVYGQLESNVFNKSVVELVFPADSAYSYTFVGSNFVKITYCIAASIAINLKTWLYT